MSPPGSYRPTKRRGGNPPEQYRFQSGQSGNPKGRPRKVQREEEYTISAALLNAAERLIPAQGPNGTQQIRYKDALANEILMNGLKNSRIGLCVVATLDEWEREKASNTNTNEINDEAIDSIIEREVQRRMRQLLQRRGMTEEASKLVDEMYPLNPPDDTSASQETRSNNDAGKDDK